MHTIKIAIICSFALLTAACNTRTVSRTGPGGVAKPSADEAATPIGPLPTRTVAPKVSVSTDGALALAKCVMLGTKKMHCALKACC